MQKKALPTTVIAIVAILLITAIPVSRAIALDSPVGHHLFILSGQSNMVGMDPTVSFTPTVNKALGKDRVLVVKDAASGQSIRSWCKSNHEFPPPTTGRVPKTRGELYGRLLKRTQAAMADKTLQTVTLVWMQGESDLNNTAYDAYLSELLEQLKSDLNAESINLVIGRISDHGLDRQKRLEGRLNIRKVQQEFADADAQRAWVNTDDLNDRIDQGKTIHDLHYHAVGYQILGKRFAEKAIELIDNKDDRHSQSPR
ncbi:MAG: sialate O-acetylesterase [Rubripirellula sp.]|nr:sialate O-acetylesterase [Rubripirellula sp.]